MDDLVAWLTGVLDEEERVTRWAATDETTGVDESADIEPAQAALARVEAERAILREHRARGARADDGCERCFHAEEWSGGDDYRDYPCETLRLLAWGHRYDRYKSPGSPRYRDEWAPESVPASRPTPEETAAKMAANGLVDPELG